MPPRTSDRWDPRLTAHLLLRASSRERGTILLMVVGVLALLAIIGVVYATLGKSDRAAGATRVQKNRSAEQVEDVGTYIASVIADGALATYTERNGNQNTEADPWTIRRRGYTLPQTDVRFLSILPRHAPGGLPGQTFEYALFNPSGTWSPELQWANFNQTDPRRFGDPYLSSLEPEFLGVTGEVVLRGNPADLGNRHDLRAISNFAPSGNFVNLANLRISNGGFNAEPGFGQNSSGRPRMSFGLTLYSPANGRPIPHTLPQTWPDTTIDPAGAVTWTSVSASPLIPAHWTMNQVWAFRPTVADELDAANGPITPASYEYAFNQWADADGDGFFDSRWFAIDDVSQLFGPAGTATAKTMLSGRGRPRLFVAARCIDACSMVNVNVAGDGWFSPQPITPTEGDMAPRQDTGLSRDNALPLGLHPGEINIRRLLTHSDIAAFMGTPSANGGAGLPGGLNGASPYALLSTPANAYANEPDQAGADYSNNVGYNTEAAFWVGRDSGGKLFNARNSGVTQGTNYDSTKYRPRTIQQRLADYVSLASPAKGILVQGTGPTARRYSSAPVLFDIADELELRTFFGVNDSDSLSRLEVALAAGSTHAARFQFYSPLRDNRPRLLEMKGRDEFGPTDLFTGYNPGTDDGRRQTLVSVFADVRHLLTTVSAVTPVKDASVAPDTYSLLNAPNANWIGLPVGGAAAPTDISGALRAIAKYSSYDRLPTFNDPLRGSPATGLPTKEDFLEYQLAVSQIFRLYLNALAPYTVEAGASATDPCFTEVWSSTNNVDPAHPNEYQFGLVYGGIPEVAVRMAAHMTVNLIDAFDRDRMLDIGSGRAKLDGTSENRGIDRNDPTVIDLQLAQNANTMPPQLEPSFKDVHAFPTTNVTLPPATPPLPIAYSNDRRMSPTIDVLPSASANGNQHAGVVKVIGIEAQPFIAEVSTYFIFAGDPNQDTNGTPGVPGGTSGTGRQPPTQQQVTITVKTTPDLVGNSDFIGEIFGVQLTNPFDQDVVLYDPRLGPTTDPWAAGTASGTDTQQIDRYRYYLEYAGHYYVFARQKTDSLAFAEDDNAKNEPVVLRAGETRVFYFTNPGSLQAMATRATARTAVGGTISAQMIEQWLTGRWLGGKPEESAAGNGQFFLRDAHNVSPGTNVQDVRDGDPSRPQQMVQVQDNIRFIPTVEGANNRVDLWGLDVNGNTTLPISTADHAPQRRVVQLWRFRRSDSTTSTATFTPPVQGDALNSPNNPGTQQNLNDPTNDILADRLRDHAGDLQDAIPTDSTYNTASSTADSRGSLYEPRIKMQEQAQIVYHPGATITPTLTIVAHGRITRPTDTQYDPTSTPINKIARGTMRVDASTTPYKRLGRLRGVLPPWCLEVRSDDDIGWGTTRQTQQLFSLNKGESVPSPFPSLVPTPLPGENQRPALLTIGDIIDDTAGNFRPTVTLASSASVYSAATYDPGTAARPQELFRSLNELFSYPVPINPEIAKPCEQKIGNDIHVNREDKDYRDVAVEFHQVGEDRLGGASGEYEQVGHYVLDTTTEPPTTTLITKQVPVRRSRNPMLFSRAGDFLLPLAVGPWFDPSRQGTAQATYIDWVGADQELQNREVQWMTLSESLALATGYYGPANPSDPYKSFARLDTSNPQQPHYPLVDRGHLVLDRFSPYLQTEQMRAGNRNLNYPLGSGAPFALSILDQFRVAPGIASTPLGSQFVPEFMLLHNTLSALGSPDQSFFRTPSGLPDSESSLMPVLGKINLNTGTLFTLSTIPMLNPGLNPKLVRPVLGTALSAASPNAGIEDNWLFDPKPFDFGGHYVVPPNLPTPVPPVIDVTFNFYDGLRDGLIGYRNNNIKLPTGTNFVSRGDPNTGDNPLLRMGPGIKSKGELGSVTMRHLTGPAAGEHMLNRTIFQFAAAESLDAFKHDLGVVGPDPAGTFSASAVPYKAPRASFHGENISAGFYDRRADGRLQDGTPPAGQSQPGQNWYARRTYDASGAESAYPVSGIAQVNPIQRVSPSEADRSYQAKLAILNSVAGSASVRSDVFIVYFLVHAYTPEDVDIPDDQPLVPNTAKRFVMVVDRSGVRNTGDKPKILMLKEVPIN
jgi:hypothetical protein